LEYEHCIEAFLLTLALLLPILLFYLEELTSIRKRIERIEKRLDEIEDLLKKFEIKIKERV